MINPKTITVNAESFVPRAEFLALLDAVSKMREAQQDYFRNREKESLIAAKEYESLVDRIIKIYEA